MPSPSTPLPLPPTEGTGPPSSKRQKVETGVHVFDLRSGITAPLSKITAPPEDLIEVFHEFVAKGMSREQALEAFGFQFPRNGSFSFEGVDAMFDSGYELIRKQCPAARVTSTVAAEHLKRPGACIVSPPAGGACMSRRAPPPVVG